MPLFNLLNDCNGSLAGRTGERMQLVINWKTKIQLREMKKIVKRITKEGNGN